MKIALIGTGMMGERMGGRLLDAGHELAVYNRTRARTAALEARGAAVADTPRAAAAGSEFLITMLADAAALRATAQGESGFLGAPGDRLWIDMSTVSPAESRELAAEAHLRGVRVLDAPVSGSLGAAVKGMLVILVGGPAEDVAAAKPLFDVLGRATLHLGPSGAGSATKLALNAFLLATMVAGSEALRLGSADGVRREKLLDAFARTEILPAWTLGKLESLGGGEVRTAFSLALADKDMRLVDETAAALELELPLAKTVAGVYARALAAGLGDRDFSAVDAAG
ncbi:MAG: NAD(P)-dependent oxidoreductase [Actinobacteria bacterium]|nr:NAD(P)-dependent oxidoreductase [Actinomycetota bacterium]